MKDETIFQPWMTDASNFYPWMKDESLMTHVMVQTSGSGIGS
jgi:hypothetical protein